MVRMELQGGCYTGELCENNTIRWTDGDTWTRHDHSRKHQFSRLSSSSGGVQSNEDTDRVKSPASECEWQVLPSVDAFPGADVPLETMPASDIQECRRICRERGHG